MPIRFRAALLFAIAFLGLLQPAICANGGGGNSSADNGYITYVNAQGQTVLLADDRRPSLYTGNYGDCLGSSLINVTRFDAAYYQDNMTIIFHLEGTTALQNESVVMYIGVYAYGSSRFDLIFNPCQANIQSACPLNSSVPIDASGITPIQPSDVSDIPSIAFTIPDFEGQAILRIFANSTESEIGCYSAVVTNGNTFAQPKSVGTILGIFAFAAMLASFATAIYGEAIPTMRLHYAHSLSVGVVFAVYQHIFFTGALSMNWPSVLVAWWHNFAWSGGEIYVESMQRSIDHLIGTNVGNTSEVGAAPSTSNDVVGGGYQISQIYKRAFGATRKLAANHPLLRDLTSEIYGDSAIQRRDALPNKSDGYSYYGHPIGAGMPLPGNYSGFAGTLAQENIAVSNAFVTGLLWFLILLAGIMVAVPLSKGILELLARLRAIQHDRLKFFRDRWIGYTILATLRTCFIAFFMMMFLTIFEFTFQSSGGVKAVAAVVFLIFLVGLGGAAGYACYYKKRFVDGHAGSVKERKKLLGVLPWTVSKKVDPYAGDAPPTVEEGEKGTGHASLSRANEADDVTPTSDVVDNIHDNEDYTTKFGWLASRFRRTRWWFFAIWLLYEFVRAAFYGGASGHPLTQVFGLLVVEFIAFAFVVWARPFEGRRLNLLVVYCLGFSKVTTVALSAAFDITFNLPRITTTVIGIVIIVIQGILTIITLIAIVVGCISSYMSVSRNREQFRPRGWHGHREKYFDHLDRTANDLPREPKPKKEKKKESEPPAEPVVGFQVRSIKRQDKIEDEDEEFASEMRSQAPEPTHLALNELSKARMEPSRISEEKARSGAASPVGFSRPGSVGGLSRSGSAAGVSRAGSVRSLSQSNLPYGARPHRPSWSAKDFRDYIPPTEGEGVASRPRSANFAAAAEVDDYDEPSASPPQRRWSSHSRTSSLRSRKAPHWNPSSESLKIGGEVSTRDTIGNVPPPLMRSRPNSFSRGHRRSLSGQTIEDEGGEGDFQAGMQQRGSRYLPMMTPAQERDEWVAGPSAAQAEEHPQIREQPQTHEETQ